MSQAEGLAAELPRVAFTDNFSNAHVYGKTIQEVMVALQSFIKEETYIVQSGADWISVYEVNSHSSFYTARALSKELSTGALSIFIEDGYRLFYGLFENGDQVDELNSYLEYWDENSFQTNEFDLRDSPAKLHKYAPLGTSVEEISQALDAALDEFLASDGLLHIGDALGIDRDCISYCGRYRLIGEPIGNGKQAMTVRPVKV